MASAIFFQSILFSIQIMLKTTTDQFSKLKNNLRFDVISGFIVSLIALPLCLGIASASNFPPIAGVLTAMVGGVLVSLIAGSELAIKGPAAGLIVIVAGAVEEYGRGDLHQGYLLTATLVVITGLMQVLLGVLKVGRWADFIPSSIIHGMLAAIGIIIISKQIHLLIGIAPKEIKGMEPLELIEHIPKSLVHLEWHIAAVGITSLVLLFLLQRSRTPFIKAIPPFLIVIVVAVIIARFMHLSNPEFKFYNALIDPGKLELAANFESGIFASENLLITIKYFFLMTIIGTIESMLTVKSVDLLDPKKRHSDQNKDVIALGIGNVVSGLLGGMPMISEVARSSANINNHAKSRLSGFFHGVFLSAFVIIFVPLIKLIPVAALSSILIFVGWRLANPKDFLKAFKVSNEHFLVFITTTIVTVSVDMLVGVFTGIALKIFINFIKSGLLKDLFKANVEVVKNGNQTEIFIGNAAVFTNWMKIKSLIDSEQGKRIVLDFSGTTFADSAFIENVYRFKSSYKGECIIRGLQEMHPVKNDPISMRKKAYHKQVLTIELTPYEAKLKQICNEQHFIIAFNTSVPSDFFIRFKNLRNCDLRSTRIYISGTINGQKFEYLEGLVYDAVDMLEYSISALVTEFREKTIPKFMLQKETKLETMIDIIMRNQVSFETYPKFNREYSVYSRDKELVNQIFSEEVINLFDTHNIKDSIIEGDGKHSLIIYNSRTNKTVSDFEFLLEFVKDFSSALNKETIHV